jgi:hypothetical protein
MKLQQCNLQKNDPKEETASTKGQEDTKKGCQLMHSHFSFE